jgi:hypothetical protein
MTFTKALTIYHSYSPLHHSPLFPLSFLLITTILNTQAKNLLLRYPRIDTQFVDCLWIANY